MKEGGQSKEKKLEVVRAPILSEDDHLFGVLSESQVGMDHPTGRIKIVLEALEEMRNYLLGSEGPERRVREERVKNSVDPLGQKIMLRLEPPPLIFADIDKGKGLVFDFEWKEMEIKESDNRKI